MPRAKLRVRAHDGLADVTLCVDDIIPRHHVGRALAPELILFGDRAPTQMSRVAYCQLKRSTKSDSVYDPPTSDQWKG